MSTQARPKATKTAAGAPRSRANKVVPRGVIAVQVGGHLALDFCNTAGEHLAERPDELLRNWESFLQWATQVGLVDPDSYGELIRHPEPLTEVLDLREAIYRVALSISGGRALAKRDVDQIRERADVRRPAIRFRDGVGRWRPAPQQVSDQLCGILASEALSLFCSARASRIGVCEGGECGWLFLDESRGKRRRWCDMNDCGSRAKARRYYEKHKEP